METPPVPPPDEPLFELVEATWVVTLYSFFFYAPVVFGLTSAAIVVSFLIDDWDSERARREWSLIILLALAFTLGFFLSLLLARLCAAKVNSEAGIRNDRVGGEVRAASCGRRGGDNH